MIWKFLSKAICCLRWKPPHMQLAISLSFVKLLWPFERSISYSHDQNHVHVSTIRYTPTQGVSKIFPCIHPQIKLHALRDHSLQSSMEKRTRAIWKEWEDRKEKMYTQRRYTTCSQSMSKKKEERKIAQVQRKKKRMREMVHEKESIHHPPKISTHMHILIKVCGCWEQQIGLIFSCLRKKVHYASSSSAMYQCIYVQCGVLLYYKWNLFRALMTCSLFLLFYICQWRIISSINNWNWYMIYGIILRLSHM